MRFKLGLGFAMLNEGKWKTRGVKKRGRTEEKGV